MVRLLPISTAVLSAPSVQSRWWLASAKAVGVEVAVDGVGQEQPAEEHDLLGQEHPHPERRGLLLLLEVREVMRERRVVRARARLRQRLATSDGPSGA